MDDPILLELTEEELALLTRLLNAEGFNVPAPLVRTVGSIQEKLDQLNDELAKSKE